MPRWELTVELDYDDPDKKQTVFRVFEGKNPDEATERVMEWAEQNGYASHRILKFSSTVGKPDLNGGGVLA